jgi:hypothetical protein
MGPKCHTGSREFWTSEIKGTPDGTFTVNEFLGGAFDGEFDTGDQVSEGHCTGKTISFVRTDRFGRQRFYFGVFHGSANEFIHGIRIGFRRKDRPDDETWDGTKTGGDEGENTPARLTKNRSVKVGTKKRGQKKK